jgi:RNA polymerase sigma-70 factor, ECF subfamily
MADQTEQEIIRKAMNGDTEAFRLLISHNQTFLYSVAYRFLGNAEDAEDMVQEAFIRMWRNFSKYKVEIKLTTWLYRIIVNLCLDVLKSPRHKRQKSHVDVSEEWSLAHKNEADDEVQTQELHTIIQEAASDLTPKQKAVFILRDLEALSVEEVCSILSMTSRNVKSNLYCARQQLSEKLKKYYQTTDKIVTL